jgi:hypothetical protein
MSLNESKTNHVCISLFIVHIILYCYNNNIVNCISKCSIQLEELQKQKESPLQIKNELQQPLAISPSCGPNIKQNVRLTLNLNCVDSVQNNSQTSEFDEFDNLIDYLKITGKNVRQTSAIKT